jgi:hypothetical protein
MFCQNIYINQCNGKYFQMPSAFGTGVALVGTQGGDDHGADRQDQNPAAESNMSDKFTGGVNTNISQGGKSGGDTSGLVGVGVGAAGSLGGGFASGSSSADAGMSVGATGMSAGDVTDNTSIGSININS